MVQASAVCIGGRALMIDGPAGCGKSTLALALIDRGATLIGDDAVTLTRHAGGAAARIVATPPPNIEGLIELRGIGIFELPVAPPVPLALILMLGAPQGERLPECVPVRDMWGVAIPCLPFDPGATGPAIRAEYALARHGIVCE